MSAAGTGERRVAAAPVAVRVMLAAALAAQIGWHVWRPDPRAEAQALRPAPPAAVLRVAALGDETAFAKLLVLRLQAHDDQPGVSIPFMDLDYGRLEGWLDAILDLDPRAAWPLLAAVRLYGSVPDPGRQRVMFDLVHRRFLEDPGRRWPWLAQAAVLAKHRLGDPALALRYARTLAAHAAGHARPVPGGKRERSHRNGYGRSGRRGRRRYRAVAAVVNFSRPSRLRSCWSGSGPLRPVRGRRRYALGLRQGGGSG